LVPVVPVVRKLTIRLEPVVATLGSPRFFHTVVAVVGPERKTTAAVLPALVCEVVLVVAVDILMAFNLGPVWPVREALVALEQTAILGQMDLQVYFNRSLALAAVAVVALDQMVLLVALAVVEEAPTLHRKQVVLVSSGKVTLVVVVLTLEEAIGHQAEEEELAKLVHLVLLLKLVMVEMVLHLQ
jgi:hypothetical protein